jgi:hypothetical protein
VKPRSRSRPPIRGTVLVERSVPQPPLPHLEADAGHPTRGERSAQSKVSRCMRDWVVGRCRRTASIECDDVVQIDPDPGGPAAPGSGGRGVPIGGSAAPGVEAALSGDDHPGMGPPELHPEVVSVRSYLADRPSTPLLFWLSRVRSRRPRRAGRADATADALNSKGSSSSSGLGSPCDSHPIRFPQSRKSLESISCVRSRLRQEVQHRERQADASGLEIPSPAAKNRMPQ